MGAGERMEGLSVKQLQDEAGHSFGYMSIVMNRMGALDGWDRAVDVILDMAGDAYKKGLDARAHDLRELAKHLRSHEARAEIDAERKEAWEKRNELLRRADELLEASESDKE